ncbi:IS30 family transposase [Neptunomonas antarctica]|uniref:Transposase and inactivated derivatives, IS30 family n=1 Tax=Neptunomonas antarctica TaxID=619304 RepID=A0A1N7IW22_9GAMM|nr:IS30 family transposase [Neptunomonas antarctica]SIS41244.1 Transposase and inactivated derivatives, IS30 family [Neptunomonas antarctica]
MSYQQLTEGKRYQISLLISQGFSAADIARFINVHRSTLGREIKRNSLAQCYQPEVAETLTQKRRRQSIKYSIPTHVVVYVEWALSFDWSPEQISEVGKTVGYRVSHEWIYRHVAADKASGGQLFRHLRQGHKRYRRGKNGKCSPIPNRVSIDVRPSIVESRKRVGDWEADTVLGKQGTGVLVTLAERKSRLYLVQRVDSKHSDVVTQAIIDMLTPYKESVHTITFDNGGEFAGHEKIAKSLEAEMYFAHPYSSWERGLNENFNGLLRQYIPKGTDLRGVSDEYVRQVQTRINLRPRKCLGFKQPQKIFDELCQAA